MKAASVEKAKKYKTTELMQRGVAYGSGRDSSPWITSKKCSKAEVLPLLI